MHAGPLHIHCSIAMGWRWGRDVLHGVLQVRQERKLNWGITCPLWRQDEVWSLSSKAPPHAVFGTFTQAHKVAEWLNQGIPVVNISGGGLMVPGLHTVTVDNTVVGRMAAMHFRERGLCSFAAVIDPGLPVTRQRFESFRLNTDEKGPVFLHEGYRIEELEAFLTSLPVPCGIFCPTDHIGRMVLNALAGLGKSVPEDYAVVGVDDDPLQCQLCPVPLSSLDVRPVAIGRHVAETLIDLLEGKSRPMVQLLPPGELRLRYSSDMFAVPDSAIVSLLRRIRERATEGIRAADVLERKDGSRRTMEIKFRKFLGRSIEDEIRRCRLEAARDCLLSSSLTLDQVAERCGFASTPHFSRLFKATFGTSPKKFRDM